MDTKYVLRSIAIALFLGIILLTIVVSSDRKTSNEYFKNLNLELTGIVTDKKVVTNDAGLIYVDVRSTSIPEYDVRNSSAYYYCVIHKNKAEIIEGGLFEIHIGDSIVVNSKNNSFELFRNREFVSKKTLSISQFAPIAFGVKSLHRF